jgi:hypothetical protein
MKAPAPNWKTSPPYSRAFTGAADLTTQVPQAPTSSSGAVLVVTTVSPTLSYKDSAGTTVTPALGAMPVGATLDLPFAMSTIESLTNATLIVYWHPINGA